MIIHEILKVFEEEISKYGKCGTNVFKNIKVYSDILDLSKINNISDFIEELRKIDPDKDVSFLCNDMRGTNYIMLHNYLSKDFKIEIGDDIVLDLDPEILEKSDVKSVTAKEFMDILKSYGDNVEIFASTHATRYSMKIIYEKGIEEYLPEYILKLLEDNYYLNIKKYD